MIMKTKTIAAIAVLIAAVGIAVTENELSNQTVAEAPAVTKTERKPKPRIATVVIEPVAENNQADAEAAMQPADELENNLDAWSRRFDELVATSGDRLAAMKTLRAEIDGVFSQWVTDAITPLVELPAHERYDKLEIIAQTVREGAAAVLERLAIPGSRHDSLASTAMDMVRAEIEYAEAAPDHASRLAMLKIDLERQNRLHGLSSIHDEKERAQAASEIEAWYDTSLATVFPDNGSNDTLE